MKRQIPVEKGHKKLTNIYKKINSNVYKSPNGHQPNTQTYGQEDEEWETLTHSDLLVTDRSNTRIAILW